MLGKLLLPRLPTGSLGRAMSTAATSTPQAAPATASPPPPPNPDLVEVFVDGEALTVPKNFTVIQACDAAGVDIPRYFSDQKPPVSCLKLLNSRPRLPSWPLCFIAALNEDT
jgi:hypothetical protein